MARPTPTPYQWERKRLLSRGDSVERTGLWKAGNGGGGTHFPDHNNIKGEINMGPIRFESKKPTKGT